MGNRTLGFDPKKGKDHALLQDYERQASAAGSPLEQNLVLTTETRYIRINEPPFRRGSPCAARPAHTEAVLALTARDK